MTPVRLEPAAPRSRVKHSTTEPLRSHNDFVRINKIKDITAINRKTGQHVKKTFSYWYEVAILMPKNFKTDKQSETYLDIFGTMLCPLYRSVHRVMRTQPVTLDYLHRSERN